MQIHDGIQLDFSDLLISPKRSTLNSRSEVDLFRTFEWTDRAGQKQTLHAIPVVIANMATIAIPSIAKIAAKRGFMIAMEKHLSLEALDSLYSDLENLAKVQGLPENEYSQRVMPSIGMKESLDVIRELDAKHHLKCICVDVPNGYIPKFVDRVNVVSEICPSALVFCGNVVTGDICQDLILHAHGLVSKVGIGQGSCCITRVKTGVGRPQASTVIDCADACHQVNGFCCSDGGCQTPGDIVKAFGCGADFVMLGGMIAGCEEADSEVKYINNTPHKQFYGMSSNLAQEKLFGGRRPSSTTEGREKWIPVVGTLDEILNDIEGGIKSAMCYIGARKIKSIPKNCTFYRVNNQLNLKFASCKDI